MKKQRGRSMVEMLGTLAIIGVLSVTALTGYKIAMTKNRTNNILYDVNLAMNEIATREYMSLPVNEEAPVSDLGVKSEFDIGYARLGGEEKNGFYIAVSNITEEVCETLRSNKTAFMTSIQPNNNETALTSCTGANAVLMKFPYPPIEGGEVEEPAPCDSDEYFKNGRCLSCPSDATCNGTANVICNGTSRFFNGYQCDYCPIDATCDGTANVICESTQYFDGMECKECPEGATCDGINSICEDTNKHWSSTGCKDCPSGMICDGTANPQCSGGKVVNHYDGSWYCCSADQYFNGYRCDPCPSGMTCNGTKNPTCSDTTKYFNNGWCWTCPSDAVCNGTSTVTCTSGTWNGSSCS